MKLAFYKGVSLTSKLIRWQSRGPYSHVAIQLDDGTAIEAWEGGKRSGVRRIASLGDGHTPGTVVDLFDFDHTPEQSGIILDFLKAQLGKKYDYSMVFRFLEPVRFFSPDTGSVFDSGDSWFCSELAMAALMKAAILLLCRIEPYKVSPSQLATSPLLHFAGSIVTQDETVRTETVPIPGLAAYSAARRKDRLVIGMAPDALAWA